MDSAMSTSFHVIDAPCFICCKSTSDFVPQLDDIIKRRNSLRLLSRQLELDISQIDNSEWRSCADCYELLENYASTYHKWKCSELQVNLSIYKIQNAMKLADKVPSNVIGFRHWSSQRDVGKDNQDSVLIRANLKHKCSKYRSKSQPLVHLPLNDSALKVYTGESVERRSEFNHESSKYAWFMSWIAVLLLSLIEQYETLKDNEIVSIGLEEELSIPSDQQVDIGPVFKIKTEPVSDDDDEMLMPVIVNVSGTTSSPRPIELPDLTEAQDKPKRRALRETHKCKQCQVTFSSKSRLEVHARTCEMDCEIASYEAESSIAESSALEDESASEPQIESIIYTPRRTNSNRKSSTSASCFVQNFRKVKSDAGQMSHCVYGTASCILQHSTLLMNVGKFEQNQIQHSCLINTSNRNEFDRFECGICGKTFWYESSLHVHTWSHSRSSKGASFGPRNQIFQYTSSTQMYFSNRTEYDDSMITSDSPDSPCSELPTTTRNKTFRKKQFKSHKPLRKHSGSNKMFKCSYCSKRCSTKASLQLHSKTHNGRRPFQCSLCPARYSTKAGLEYHVLTHTGEKPYKCNVCGRRFRSKQYAKKHTKLHADSGEAVSLRGGSSRRARCRLWRRTD